MHSEYPTLANTEIVKAFFVSVIFEAMQKVRRKQFSYGLQYNHLLCLFRNHFIAL